MVQIHISDAKYTRSVGITTSLIGLLLIIAPHFIGSLVVGLLGVALIAIGVMGLFVSLSLFRGISRGFSTIPILMGIILIVFPGIASFHRHRSRSNRWRRLSSQQTPKYWSQLSGTASDPRRYHDHQRHLCTTSTNAVFGLARFDSRHRSLRPGNLHDHSKTQKSKSLQHFPRRTNPKSLFSKRHH